MITLSSSSELISSIKTPNNGPGIGYWSVLDGKPVNGIEIPRKVIKIKGEDVEVQVLPPLKADNINGVPVIALIDAGKPYKNIEWQERTPYVVKFVKQWEGGVKKDAEIPF